jgi:methionyl-tRNA formyltransferase
VSARSDLEVTDAVCVVFAYHEMGHACLAELIRLGAPVAALFSHRDDPHEEIWWRSCAELAARHNIAVHYPDKIDAEWTARIAVMRPAIIYSFSYRHLIAQEVLGLAPMGAYNLHPSPLPRYRGRAPVNWMLANGEREAGVTLHHMVARADAGDIVAQKIVAIDDADTALTLYQKLVPAGAAIVRECHPQIVAGTAPQKPQDLAAGSYFGRRRPEDGKIDWRWPARQVFNLVRAVSHPYPGAFCYLGDRKLFIWQARIANESGSRGEPGEIIGEDAGGALEVAAGDGSVLVIRAQLEGGAEGAARNVAAAHLLEGSIVLRSEGSGVSG